MPLSRPPWRTPALQGKDAIGLRVARDQRAKMASLRSDRHERASPTRAERTDRGEAAWTAFSLATCAASSRARCLQSRSGARSFLKSRSAVRVSWRVCVRAVFCAARSTSMACARSAVLRDETRERARAATGGAAVPSAQARRASPRRSTVPLRRASGRASVLRIPRQIRARPRCGSRAARRDPGVRSAPVQLPDGGGSRAGQSRINDRGHRLGIRPGPHTRQRGSVDSAPRPGRSGASHLRVSDGGTPPLH